MAKTDVAADWGCGVGTAWDAFYCPKYRGVTLGAPDLIGVYAVYTYKDVSNLLPGGTLTLTDQAIYTAQPAV